jgi:hypothetical protein
VRIIFLLLLLFLISFYFVESLYIFFVGVLFLELTHVQKKRVRVTLKFSRLPANVTRMDYDAIVTNAALRERFAYDIPNGKVKLKWRQNLKPRLLGLRNHRFLGGLLQRKPQRKRSNRRQKSQLQIRLSPSPLKLFLRP